MNDMLDLRIDSTELCGFYRRQLLDDFVPFWTRHSLDLQHGGYLTFLRRDGTPYGYTKYLWPQAREAYLFSKLHNTVEKRSEWLEASRLGVEFIRKHAFVDETRVHFRLTRNGLPILDRPGEIFSEAFVVMALAEFARASGLQEYLDGAFKLFWGIVGRLQTGELDKYSFVVHPLYQEHAPTMIMINTAQELRGFGEDERLNKLIERWVSDELHRFASDEHEAMFERVGLDGKVDLSEPEGRSITPGHCMESSWFCMTEGFLHGRRDIVARAAKVIEWTIRRGWDPEFGGVFNFVDFRGDPPGHHDEHWGEDQDWDAKLDWVHSEALYAVLLAYQATGDGLFLAWYRKLHEWSFSHFPDPENGEWFGYLRRDGTVSQSLKGAMKGFFHVPRAFLNCMLLLEKMGSRQGSSAPQRAGSSARDGVRE